MNLALRRLLRNLFQPIPFLRHLVAFDDFTDNIDRSDFRRLITMSCGCPSLIAPDMNSAVVGPPRFRCQPFARELAIDPGGATPSRIATAHMLPSLHSTNSASATFLNFVARSQSSRDLCLRFRPCVTAPPARLDTSLSATTLAGRDSHPLVNYQLLLAHTVGESDFSLAFIIGFGSSPSRCGPHSLAVTSEISRFPSKELLHMPGSADHARSSRRSR